MATTTCPPVRGRQNSIANGVGGGVSAYQQIQQPTQANNQSQQRKDSHIMDQSEYGMMDSNSDASFQGDFNSQSQNTISQKVQHRPRNHVIIGIILFIRLRPPPHLQLFSTLLSNNT
jgi:hypothetical protein